ncbi:MAG: gliding motility-associated C-terminal domain-containing protein [Flavobacteriales bacterium]
MKLSDKIKITVFLLASILSVNYSYSQCENFTVNVIQEDNCNNNGILQVVVDSVNMSPPYTLQVDYPNSQGNYSDVFSTGTYNLTDLQGGLYDITVISGTDSCNLAIDLNGVDFTAIIFSPFFGDNGYNVSCYGDCDASIFVTIVNPTESYTIDWYLDSISGLPFHSASSTSSNQSGLCAGEYAFEFTSASGCVRTRNWTLREPDSLYVDGAVTDVLCSGQFEGEIDVDVTGGVGEAINVTSGLVTDTLDYQFVWTGPNGFSSSDEDLTSIEGGTYNLTVSDANGCSYSKSFVVLDTVSVLQLAEVNTDSVSCFGGVDGSIEVLASGATGPYEYRINGGNWQQSSFFGGLSANPYNVEAKDANDCVVSLNIEVFEYEDISHNVLSLDTIFCVDSLASFEVEGVGGKAPYQYTITSPQSTGLFPNLTAGLYQVSITDANACPAHNFSVIVQEVAPLSVNVTIDDLSCFNSNDGEVTVLASDGSTPYSFTVGTSPTITTNSTALFPGLQSGTYNLSVTDAKNCPFDTTIQVNQPGQMINTIAFVTPPSCFGSTDASISVSTINGQGNVDYIWTKNTTPILNETTSTITQIDAGVYTVSATDDEGCVSPELDITVNDPSQLVLDTLSISNPTCFNGSNGQISVFATGGTQPWNFQWSGLSNATTALINGLTQGNYEAVVTDIAGCTDTLSIDLVHPTEMSISPTITDVNCFGESTGQFSLDVLGGTPSYASITHVPNLGITSTTGNNNLTVSNLPSGTYVITIEDNNSCTYLDSIFIDQNSQIDATFQNVIPETCNGVNGSVSIVPSGGIPQYSYNWIELGETTSTVSQLSGGQTLNVVVADILSCSENFNVFIPKSNSVEINSVSVNDNECFGSNNGSITVASSGDSKPFSFTLTSSTGSTNFTSSDSITILNNLVADTYTLSVVDTVGCVDNWNQSIVLSEPTDITVDVDSSLSTLELACNGDENGKLFLNISGGTPFAGNYYWMFVNDPSFSQQITVDSLTGLSVGTYNLSIQDANGCIVQTSYEILQPDPLAVSQIVNGTSCNESSDGNGLIIVSGGTPTYTITPFDPLVSITSITNDTFEFSSLSEGLYYFDIEDSEGCKKLNNSFYVSEPTVLEILNTSSTLESCLGWDAEASVSVAGGSGNYTYLWTYDRDFQLPLQLQDSTLNQTSNQPNVENLTSGLIYIHVWDLNSCYTLDSIIISQSTSPILSLIGTVDNVCNGDTEGQISLNASGGTPYYEYSINGGVNWQYLSTFNDLGEGLYNATVRDSLGCSSELENIQINAPTPISVSVDSEQASCIGFSDGSASVISVSGGTSASGSYSYSWQNSQGVNLWPANLSAVNATVSGLAAGIYQLEVEDDNGCSTVYSPVIIAEPSQVTLGLSVLSDYNGNEISCFGLSDAILLANAGGGTGLYTFEWFNTISSNDIRTQTTSSTDTLYLVPQDQYTVVVTDEKGCTATENITITQPEQLVVSIEDVIHIRCEGNNDGQATATYSGGLGFGNYAVSWSDSSNNVISLIAQATNLPAGTYTATYTDNNGCSNSDSVTINYSELFSISNLSDTTSVSCLGSIDGSFNFNVTGGWLPYSYTWSDPLNQQSATAVGLAPGMWYTNIITDANNCILVDSVYVTSPTSVVNVNTYSVVDNECYDDNSGSITVDVSGGSTNYEFYWTGPDTDETINNVNSGVRTINGLATGTYNLLITDANGCQNTSTYVVDGPDSPLQINYVTTTDVSCNGLEDGEAQINTSSSANQVVGGTPPYVNVNWFGENPTILSADDYEVEVTDNNDCKTTVSFTINEPNPYSVSLDLIDEPCQGENASIITQVSGGTPFVNGYYNYNIEAVSEINPTFSYQESSVNDPNIIIDFPENNDEADTLFTLTITDDNGCEYTEQLEIHPARVFIQNETLYVCFGDTITLYGDRFENYDSYLWSVNPVQEIFDNGSSVDIIVENSLSISATVYDNSSVCSFTDNLSIEVLTPEIIVNEDIGILRGESITLSISQGETPFSWSNGELSNTITVSPLITTHYIAHAFDKVTGCIGNDTVRVFVGMNEGFSPNGDGYNDTWEISYLNQYETAKIEVFNRWGASLWKSSSPDILNWDGRHNGKDLPIGTYYYVITFDESSDIEPLTGPVTIVR